MRMAKNLKIKKTSAADLVCRKMRELIVDGTWAINEKIPSEADLAENFGVNRLTVRIALQRLNALGVLETRVGEGTFVRSFDFDKHLAEISQKSTSKTQLGKIFLDSRIRAQYLYNLCLYTN